MRDPASKSSNSWKHSEARRCRWRRASRRPSDEELTQALALWALLELLPQEGELGVQAKAEVKRLGIDVSKAYLDVKRITLKFFGRTNGLDPEDLLQEVLLAILRKNASPKSAFDPSRSSFGHYVHLVAKSVVLHMLEARRWAREASASGESIDRIDERNPIGAYEHCEASPRLSRSRVLDRSRLGPEKSILN